MGCGVVPGNVYALSGCHCGPYSSSINNRSSIGMIGCFRGEKMSLFLIFSVLVANPKKLFYTVANPACGLLNKEKKSS